MIEIAPSILFSKHSVVVSRIPLSHCLHGKVMFSYLDFIFMLAFDFHAQISGCRKSCGPSGMDVSIPGGNYKPSRGVGREQQDPF